MSANQVAGVLARNVTRISLQREPLAQGGKGCFYDVAVPTGDQLTDQYVVFSYFRDAGQSGFQHWADPGTPISGLGISAIWGSSTLTVLTRENDVVAIYLFTSNADLTQAEQIYRIAEPKL